jgi:hypothetical protein
VAVLWPVAAECFWLSWGDPNTHATMLTDEAFGVFEIQGFEAQLGVSDLVTSRTVETHKTFGASLVLFDKAKNVIWKAP